MESSRDTRPSRSGTGSRGWDALRDYRPRRALDYLFLHGFAIHAARRALREGPPLYVPAEWHDEESDDAPRLDA